MTDYHTIEAGAELDLRVHETIMANRHYPDGSLTTIGAIVAPKYSTDMAAAWLVVEAVSNGKNHMVVFHAADGWHAATLDCQDEFGEYYIDTDLSHHARAATAALAICRAALKAVGA